MAQDDGVPAFTSSLLPLGDINGDGSQDIAVLSESTAIVKDAASGALIQNVAFNNSTNPNKFITVPDLNGNGAPELLLLGNGATQTEARDSLSGALLSSVSFNPNYAYVDVAVVPDQDGSGAPELALLGKQTSTGYVKVETRDALSGNLVATTGFSTNCIPKQLLVLPDVDGNGLPEFAVLCANVGAINKVEIRNTNGTLVRNIWLDKTADYLQMTLLDDINRNGSPELALLYDKPAISMLDVRIVDALTGKTIKEVPFNPNFTPLKLVVLPDLTGNGSAELALLGHNLGTGNIKAEIHDAATGVLVKNVWFDKTYLPQDLAVIQDMSGNGVAELGMLGLRESDSARRVFIKDAGTGIQINVVAFDDALTNRAMMVDAGWFHTCGLKTDGSIACWGGNAYGETTPPVGNFSQVSAGYLHTCGIKTDGSVACWGRNEYGESAPPVENFSQVSAGGEHSCGIKSDGSVVCWGRNDLGQSTPPVGSFSQISAGAQHSCGVKVDGSVACWGENRYGKSTPPAGSFSQISTGGEFTCGIKIDGSVACWGNNGWYGATTPPVGTFSQISSGGLHTCGVKTSGSVKCWGYKLDGQTAPPAGSFSQVSSGAYHTCGIKTDGSVACWGRNDDGQTTPPPGW